jgi:hypothetical protein
LLHGKTWSRSNKKITGKNQSGIDSSDVLPSVTLGESIPYSKRRSEDHGGSAEEPQKNRRKYEGNLRQCDEEVDDHAIT